MKNSIKFMLYYIKLYFILKSVLHKSIRKRTKTNLYYKNVIILNISFLENKVNYIILKDNEITNKNDFDFNSITARKYQKHIKQITIRLMCYDLWKEFMLSSFLNQEQKRTCRNTFSDINYITKIIHERLSM